MNTQAKWNEIIERQLKTMKRWNPMYPWTMGRILIAKALIILMAHYLMTLDGTP